MTARNRQQIKTHPLPWVPLSSSAWFIFRSPRLLGWSLLLVLITAAFTWGGFILTTGFMDELIGSFIRTEPPTESWWGWIKYAGWLVAKYLFLVVSRVVAFFLAFLVAYSLTAPLYSFLSSSAEKIYCGDDFEADEGFSISGVCKDLWEGMKIGGFGIVVTIMALFISFIPVLGQLSVFVLYAYYSTLMFIDYPASRRRWNLGRKLGWLRENGSFSFRLGVLPAAVSMIPLLNLFLIALIFPLFTVHATLNFYIIEHNKRVMVKPRSSKLTRQ